MTTLYFWLIVVSSCLLRQRVHSGDSWFQIDDEDGILSVPDLIAKYGYGIEEHAVTTEDGYELTMFRIIQKQSTKEGKLPVLMVHGLFGSAADFVIIGPNNSLAYLLADRGYDVWLGNARGTRYSRKHSKFSLESKTYWDFSWHEIGYYDLPAMIDYMTNATKVSRINYVGFSQGTTAYFVMSSTRSEYNEKVAFMTALSPAVFLKRVRSPLLLAAMPFFGWLMKLTNWQKIYEILPYNILYNQLVGSVCSPDDSQSICPQMIGNVAGPHPESYDKQAMAAYAGHFPAGASVKQLAHYMQVIHSGLFRWYNRGKAGNQRVYRSDEPPFYNLSASSAPVLIYYGLNDWLVHPMGVREFAKTLPNVVAAKPVEDKKFNHLDFILAKNVRSLIYDDVIRMFGERSNL